MRTVEELHQQIAFERWANRAQVESLATVAAPSEDLLRITWHLLAAIENWLSRIEGIPPAASLDWRTPVLEEVTTLLEEVDTHYGRALEALSEARLGESVGYTNTAGRRYTNLVGDILEHLMLHSAEHRGQIAREVGRLGGSPVETEYIWFVRDRPA
jgi:uncharacterized damage-inducible protein DinB